MPDELTLTESAVDDETIDAIAARVRERLPEAPLAFVRRLAEVDQLRGEALALIGEIAADRESYHDDEAGVFRDFGREATANEELGHLLFRRGNAGLNHAECHVGDAFEYDGLEDAPARNRPKTRRQALTEAFQMVEVAGADLRLSLRYLRGELQAESVEAVRALEASVYAVADQSLSRLRILAWTPGPARARNAIVPRVQAPRRRRVRSRATRRGPPGSSDPSRPRASRAPRLRRLGGAA